MTTLDALKPGMPIVYGGDKIAFVDPALAAAFAKGDRLVVVQESGDLLHVPGAVHAIAAEAVGRAQGAFAAMSAVSDAQITQFFDAFARRLEDEAAWGEIARANDEDVRQAQGRGRSTTRLQATAKMRADMIAGLREWRDTPGGRERLVERVEHDGWSVEQVTAPLGVVGFVFEGRPNVFADACGATQERRTDAGLPGRRDRRVPVRTSSPLRASRRLPTSSSSSWVFFSSFGDCLPKPPRFRLDLAERTRCSKSQLEENINLANSAYVTSAAERRHPSQNERGRVSPLRIHRGTDPFAAPCRLELRQNAAVLGESATGVASFCFRYER